MAGASPVLGVQPLGARRGVGLGASVALGLSPLRPCWGRGPLAPTLPLCSTGGISQAPLPFSPLHPGDKAGEGVWGLRAGGEQPHGAGPSLQGSRKLLPKALGAQGPCTWDLGDLGSGRPPLRGVPEALAGATGERGERRGERAGAPSLP